jgi:hypothetical protein
VTWIRSSDGWELFANRDERRTRLPALPPRVTRRGAMRILAPVDADAEGTWIGVNERGVGLCLLNGRSRKGEEGPEGFTSRGLLVRDLLACPTLEEIGVRLGQADLGRLRGFFLFGLALGEAPVLHAWDGRSLATEREPVQPLVSSSRDTEEARRHRERSWRRLHPAGTAPTAGSLAAFHRSHEPEAGPWSVCMHREDARTVSASRVRVAAGRAEFHYAPGPPCRTGWNAPVMLACASAGRPSAG